MAGISAEITTQAKPRRRSTRKKKPKKKKREDKRREEKKRRELSINMTCPARDPCIHPLIN